MKTNRWKMDGLKLSLFAFLFAGLVSCDMEYDDWDANDDQALEESEFEEGFLETNYYDGWDANEDNTIDRNEFYDGTYSALDADNDNYISSSEWNILGESENHEYGEFSSWDGDNDQLIDHDEYQESLENNGLFDTWDEDNNSTLDEDEFVGGIFATWDANDNNRIDQNEFNEWESASNRVNNDNNEQG